MYKTDSPDRLTPINSFPITPYKFSFCPALWENKVAFIKNFLVSKLNWGSLPVATLDGSV